MLHSNEKAGARQPRPVVVLLALIFAGDVLTHPDEEVAIETSHVAGPGNAF